MGTPKTYICNKIKTSFVYHKFLVAKPNTRLTIDRFDEIIS